jgi:hypothetical protein
MDLRTSFGILRWLLVLALLFCGMTLSLAQTANNAQAPQQKTTQIPGQSKKSPPATEPSQMRGTTSEHRWAAAANHADRRAAHIRKHQRGVK